jgi:YT521-B-like domain
MLNWLNATVSGSLKEKTKRFSKMRSSILMTSSSYSRSISPSQFKAMYAVSLMTPRYFANGTNKAIMESLPGQVAKPSWVKSIHWPTSPAFRVKWIAVGHVEYDQVHKIHNSLMNGKPVTVGRDCQEIDEDAGKQLCGYLYNHMRRRVREDEKGAFARIKR